MTLSSRSEEKTEELVQLRWGAKRVKTSEEGKPLPQKNREHVITCTPEGEKEKVCTKYTAASIAQWSLWTGSGAGRLGRISRFRSVWRKGRGR